MDFKIVAIDHRGRAGVLKTSHSTIKTPVFMPVGTAGAVKGLDSQDLLELGAEIVLGNTYHLYLRPGDKVIAKLGGLHGFTGYFKSFLTDSGGFQAFSLQQNVQITEKGIWFKSHIDGSFHLFTPEKVVEIQHNLGSDILMVLDDLISLPNSVERIEKSVRRTTRWAFRSLIRHRELEGKGAIFAIVQGGTNFQFRHLSATELNSIKVDGKSFDGFAIGGLSVGESNQEMYTTTRFTASLLPEEKPRYLMGVGKPEDLVEGVWNGIDMFDCIIPTRNARNGYLYTSTGVVRIKNSRYRTDPTPIEEGCNCHTCRFYSKGYLNHLFKAKELTYYRLATIHNLHYYFQLMAEIRKGIEGGYFKEWREEFYRKRGGNPPTYSN